MTNTEILIEYNLVSLNSPCWFKLKLREVEKARMLIGMRLGEWVNLPFKESNLSPKTVLLNGETNKFLLISK